MTGTIEQYFDLLCHDTKPLGTESPVIPQDFEFQVSELLQHCIDHREVGSRVTCNPPVLDTDNDILCLVADRKTFTAEARSAGFKVGGSFPDDMFDFDRTTSQFTSLKRGDVNLIVTASAEFFQLFMLATRVAQRRNLLDKSDRIALFQHIFYGNSQ